MQSCTKLRLNIGRSVQGVGMVASRQASKIALPSLMSCPSLRRNWGPFPFSLMHMILKLDPKEGKSNLG